MPRTRHLFLTVLALASGTLCAQVGFGTLLQSIDTTQLPGVTSVRLNGNPSITTNEVVAWSQGEANGRMRALFNAQTLSILFGDRSGDGLAFDWPNIDAMEVVPQIGVNQPSPFDLRCSFSADVPNSQGAPITSGDIIRLTGIGTFAVHIARSQFQAAIGTTAALNVDGYAELSDGTVLVSFQGTGSGNNIVNPLSGSPGTNISWTGADVFLIRQPYGALPAIFAYRQTEIAAVMNSTNNYGASYTLTEVRGLAAQPNVAYIDNPSWDPANLYAGGTRPRILWIGNGDDNVFCFSNAQAPLINPLSTTNNVYCLVGNGSVSNAGYSTNTSTSRVICDALAIWPATMTTDTRSTLDANSLLPNGGTSLTLSVRGPEALGAVFQIALTTTLGTGQGTLFGTSGFRWILLNPSDPLFLWSLAPPVSTIFQTGAADALGTASTAAILLPTSIPNTSLFFQAVEAAPPFALGGALLVRVL